MSFEKPTVEFIEFDANDVVVASRPGGVVTCTSSTPFGDIPCTQTGQLWVD